MQEFFYKSDILKENYQKALKKITLFFFPTACHPYVTRVSFVCKSYVLVCHPYVTRMYSYVIRMSLVCTRMSSVCHLYVLVCHPYVTRMYLYVTPMYWYVIRRSLVCGFTMYRY